MKIALVKIGALSAIVALFMTGQLACAQTTHKPVEEMLKGIKKAGGVCRPDGSSSTEESQTRNESPDFSCGIDAVSALSWTGQQGAVVVDTRTSGEFSGFHANGALNLEVGALRAKSYLRDKKLLLAGNGKTERELYIACANLKKMGFKQVRLLRGGMPAWLLHSQPVVGQPGSLAAQLRLTPSEMWAGSRFDANVVLLAPAMSVLQKDLPMALVLRDENTEAIKSQVEKRRRGSSSSVVLVGGPGWTDERIEQLAQKLKPLPLLVFAEKPEVYKQFLTTQEAVWKARARGPKKLKCG
ncbi:MAG: hypothetical protein H6R18_478 [Proteobacteria bacterium]|nr:hypothetical protein [Pseudomonadota bacterium]